MNKFKILSMGGGVQSTTLLYLSAFDVLEHPDCVIFADTGWEPQKVYKHIQSIQELCAHLKIPFHIVKEGDIRQDISNHRFASMPLFTHRPNGKLGYAILRRQCTREYKISPIRRFVRKHYGFQPCECWLGITTDEAARIKPSNVRWMENKFPLVDLKLSRSDCIKFLSSYKISTPMKSSCLGCPFHDDQYWKNLKENSPQEWQDVVHFDHQIRQLPRLNSKTYLHRSLKPLDEIDFSSSNKNLFQNECEGHCHL